MTIDPLVFEEAALLIDEHGWWSSHMASHPENGECVANALWKACHNRGFENPQQIHEYQTTLIKHFGLEELWEVFELNDRQDEATGKEWAVTALRETAQEVRDGR